VVALTGRTKPNWGARHCLHRRRLDSVAQHAHPSARPDRIELCGRGAGDHRPRRTTVQPWSFQDDHPGGPLAWSMSGQTQGSFSVVSTCTILLCFRAVVEFPAKVHLSGPTSRSGLKVVLSRPSGPVITVLYFSQPPTP